MTGRLILVGLACAVLASSSETLQPVFRSSSSAVRLLVSVSRDGQAVRGLKADDFEVLDQGVRQLPLEVSSAEFPLSVKVVVDVSGSIDRTRLNVVNAALKNARTFLRTSDVFEGFAFASRVERLADNLIESAAPDQGSSIVDAAVFSLIDVPDLDRRAAVFFVTDGHDTTSELSGSILEQTARRTSIPFNLLLMPPGSCGKSGSALDSLKRAALETGGSCDEVRGFTALSESLVKGLQTLKSGYLVSFSPTSKEPGWHSLAVTTRDRRAQVRTRQGYWQAGGGAPRIPE